MSFDPCLERLGSLDMHRHGGWQLQLAIDIEELPVSLSHQLVLMAPLLFVRAARRSDRFNDTANNCSCTCDQLMNNAVESCRSLPIYRKELSHNFLHVSHRHNYVHILSIQMFDEVCEWWCSPQPRCT